MLVLFSFILVSVKPIISLIVIIWIVNIQAMPMNELIYFIIYIIISFGIALFLFKKFSFFKKIWGFLTALGVAVVAAILHNLVYALLYDAYFAGTEKDEPVFFIIALLSFGIFFFLFWIWLFYKLKALAKKPK